MLKSLVKPWVCTRCLSRQRQPRRLLATAVQASARPTPGYDAPRASSALIDDGVLRKVFDSRPFWQEFSKAETGTVVGKNGGLLHNIYLDSPEGFEAFANSTLERCRKLVAKILAMSTLEGYRTIVKDLDRLSDLLCRIIDLSDFVRATHPDPLYQHQAARAHAIMYEYMNTLNTTTGLNDQLKRALDNPDVTKVWSVEEMKVANILKKDFAQSAIDMPPAKRQRFIDLSTTIQDLGSRFVDEMQPAQHYLKLDSTRLKGVDPRLVKELADRRGKILLPTVGGAASHVLRHAEDENIRKQVYIASRTAAGGQIDALERMLQARAELAELSGFDSYASMALTDKMAKTPEAVRKFLEALSRDNQQRTSKEISNMRAMKAKMGGDNGINAWDRDFYRSRLSELSVPTPYMSDDLSVFFSLGTVMQGLSRLFSRLYGVRFVPAEPAPGETWHPEVRRLDVVDEQEGLIGVIYCDLFARAGKSPNPAHFTLRCSRHISREEIQEVSETLEGQGLAATVESLANDGMAVSADSTGSLNQLPIIALICDFPTPASPSTPPLLPLSQLTTLFHEMGHAIHSVLGRTKFQNVAGTRCATDFAELPSVLMENFATHPEALALYARHWSTDEPLPHEKALQLDPFYGRRAAAARARDAADTEVQIRLALLDQAFHSRAAEAPNGWNTDEISQAIDAQYALVPEPKNTRWQGFFGHLVGYGASYYSYLFDRAIAARLWEVLFASDGTRAQSPLRREAGEQFRTEVLRWGGSRDGWACVAGALGSEGVGLENGGEAAMERVGKWGLGDAQP